MRVELQFAVRIAAFTIGLLLVLTFARSMMRVALVNHPSQDGVSRNVHRLAYYVSCVLRPGKPDDISAQQRRFLSLLPVFIFLLILSWFLLVQTGFALMIWSVHAETRLGMRSLLAAPHSARWASGPRPALWVRCWPSQRGRSACALSFHFHIHPRLQSRGAGA